MLASMLVTLGDVGKDGNSTFSLKLWNDEPECPKSLIK